MLRNAQTGMRKQVCGFSRVVLTFAASKMQIFFRSVQRIFGFLPFIWIAAGLAFAQAGAPSSIQIFMPGGGLPDRSMRFELRRDDGRIETLFTDTKGKFLLTGDLVRDADYIIVVEGDGRIFASTTVTFRTFRNIVTYVPVFLNPLEGNKKNSGSVLNVIDVDVPAGARANYQQAMDALNRGETQEAIDQLVRAISAYPKYVRALNDLGVIYLHQDQLELAASTFQKAIKINQTFVYPRLNLGIVLNHMGKHVEAAEILDHLYRETSLPLARMPYAEALSETGKFAEAEKLLRAVCDDANVNDTIRAEAHFRLGALFNKQSRFADAVPEFEQAVKLQPRMTMAHLQMGGALLQLKRLPEAERELLTAYGLGGPKAGAAQLLLGQTYHAQGKYELAIQAFEKYLQDVPNAPNAAKVKDAIEKIRAALKEK